jgi:EmrB/QacA subfamily drug resistance transporter
MNQTPVPFTGSTLPPGDRTCGKNKWITLVVVTIGAFMGNLDASIVNISLPAIAHAFGTSLNGSIEWVVIGYLIVIVSVLLTLGRLADTLGRKHIWVIGLLVFTAASALCGAAPTLPLLIGARGLQGLGAACLMAVGPAILTSAFPPQERGRALGLITATIGLSISLGPTLGGLITQHFTWRGIFYVNVPLGLAGIWLALRLLQEYMPKRQRRFDVPGALCLTVGLGALMTGLSFGQEWGWTSSPLIALVMLSVLALGSLLLVERFVEYPLLARSFLTNRVFLSANVSLALGMLALFSINVLVPFYLVEVRAFAPAQAGLLLTPLPLTFALLSPFSGSLADRIGTRWLAAGGLALVCLGLVLISQLNSMSSLWDMLWRLACVGIGQALFLSPNDSALMGSMPREQQGIASGFMQTSQIAGQSLSVALAGAVFALAGGALASHILATGHGTTQTLALAHHLFLHGFQAALLVSAALAALGILTSLVRGKERPVNTPGQSSAENKTPAYPAEARTNPLHAVTD